MENETDLYSYKHYSAIDFVIGLFITLGASLLNALGLNLTKRDFTRQEALPPASRTADWKRPLWWLGLGLYILSQIVGSTLALEFLRAEYVAPLGSTSLVFNFVFAYLLVGTPVTRTDIVGTFIIVLGVVGVVVFSNQRLPSQIDTESNLSLSLLKTLWSRSDWIIYLIFLELTTIVSFWLSRIMHEVCMGRIIDERGDAERSSDLGPGGGGRKIVETGWRGYLSSVVKARERNRQRVKRALEKWSHSKPDDLIRKAAGLGWSITGGLLAGQTLVFAKSAVKLVTSAISKSDPNEANQFTSPLSWLIVILLIGSAVSQVYCLTMSLKCYDSTFTVPIFFATYTTCGFLNSLVYLDELHLYKLWAFLCIWASILVLIIGVGLLSLKKQLPRVKPPIQDAEADGEVVFDTVHLTPPVGGDVFEGKKSGGSWFSPKDRVAKGEMSREKRRNLPGTKKLEDDGDSVLNSEFGSGAGAIEMDEIDRLGEDDFGDFETAEVLEIDDEDIKNKDELNPGP